MKHARYILLPIWGILATSALLSCGENRWPEYYPYTGRDLWIDSVMRENYLWFEEMPGFDDLNYFLAPKRFLEKVRSEKDKGFSKVDSLCDTPLPAYGFDYNLSKVPENDTAYYAMITYVEPKSPASEAGLVRGEWIMKVDGDFITRKREKVLKEGAKRQLTVGKYEVHTETDPEGKESTVGVVVENRTLNLPAMRPVEKAVLPVTAFLQNEQTAYLLYNSFDSAADEDLQKFSRQCKEKQVKNLVLDLRYNERGNMESMVLLASILAPQQQLNATLAKLEYNSRKADKNRELKLGTEAMKQGSNLNLTKLYVLTSRTTAGLAEMLINGLKPYMEVVLIGEDTKGEYVATEAFHNPAFRWSILPAVCWVYNAQGATVPEEGFAADKEVGTLSDPAKVLPLGNPQEALLSAALEMIGQ